MRALKTLDAYFKPAPKPTNDGTPGTHNDNSIMHTTTNIPERAKASQEHCTGVVATLQPPKPAHLPAPASSRPTLHPAPQPSIRQPTAITPPTNNNLNARKPLSIRIPAAPASRPKCDRLKEMLHGRQATSATPSTQCWGTDVTVASLDSRQGPIPALTSRSQVCKPGGVRPTDSLAARAAGSSSESWMLKTATPAVNEPPQRPAKRMCLPPAVPLERRSSLVCLLQARSVGQVLRHRELWWNTGPRLVQVGCWDASEGLRATSVLHQDAVTQIELSSEADGCACLAVAQANQRIRIVPYSVLRDIVESRRAMYRDSAKVPGGVGRGGNGNGNNGDGDGDDDDFNSDGDQLDEDSSRASERTQAESGRRRRRAQSQAVLPWRELVDAGRIRHARRGDGDGGGGGGSVIGSLSSVLTLNTHSCVSCLGWDPRRRGRLALADRSSSSVSVLDLGWGSGGGGGGGVGGGFVRGQLNVGNSGPGGAAARAVAYLKYGSPSAPYTLAGAGRASGAGAIVHLWDERQGSQPVSQLTCPGGASLLARMEPSLDGMALLGVVHPGTLVLWDVRQASNTAASSAVFSLGSATPAPSAVVGSWDLQGPLAATGCRRSMISSLAPDPRDANRTAVLMQDGSSAIWSLTSAAITHALPALTQPDTAGGMAPLHSSATVTAAAAAGAGVGPVTGPQQLLRPSLAEVRGVDASELSSYCNLAGCGLYGAWDADVCGFWHPAAVLRTPGSSGNTDDVSALGPGLVMADCRTSCSSAAVMPPGRQVTGKTLATEEAAPLPAAPPAVPVPLSDWTLCVTCIPDTGDVIAGSVRGQVSYFWKA